MRTAVADARERGWITLDEIMQLASGSPVDADEAMHVTREAGIGLVDDGARAQDDPWTDLEHPGRRRGRRVHPSGRDDPTSRDEEAATDELMAGGPASLYLREISRHACSPPKKRSRWPRSSRPARRPARELEQAPASTIRAERAQLELDASAARRPASA